MEGFFPETLALTVAALGDALHLEPRLVVRLAELEPGVLINPAAPRSTLLALAAWLDLAPAQVANQLRTALPLLALSAGGLAARIHDTARTLGFDGSVQGQPPSSSSSSEGSSTSASRAQPGASSSSSRSGTTSGSGGSRRSSSASPGVQHGDGALPQDPEAQQRAARFRRWARRHSLQAISLLALPPLLLDAKLATLCDGLGAAARPAAVAALVRQRPLLLDVSAGVMCSRLATLSEAGQVSAEQLLQRAATDPAVAQGLADLLMLAPQRTWMWFQSLRQLLPDRQPAFILEVLLRCGLKSPAEAHTRWAVVARAAGAHPAWEGELGAADAAQVASLMRLSHQRLARLAYLALPSACWTSARLPALAWVVVCSEAHFRRECPSFDAWLAGRL